MTELEINKIFARTDAALASLAEAQARTEAQLAKTDVQLAQTNAQLAKTNATFSEAHEEARREAAETQRFMKELGRRMGAMASNQGDVAEEFFYNSLGDTPVVGGIAFDSVSKNISVRKLGKHAEFDIVLENGCSMAVVEVKYKVHPSDLEQVLSQMQRYREFFPAYKDYKLYGGIAGFSVPDDIAKQAHEQGLFVLKRKGDVMETESKELRVF